MSIIRVFGRALCTDVAFKLISILYWTILFGDAPIIALQDTWTWFCIPTFSAHSQTIWEREKATRPFFSSDHYAFFFCLIIKHKSYLTYPTFAIWSPVKTSLFWHSLFAEHHIRLKSNLNKLLPFARLCNNFFLNFMTLELSWRWW